MSSVVLQQPSDDFAKWLRVLYACGPLIPSLIALLYPPWAIPLFTPRQIIDENNLVSFLFAPWAAPTSPAAHLSRVLQAVLLWLLQASIFHCYELWILTAVLRTVVGHILTRGVGWAHPRFFSHWALYETCGGYGPSIVAYMYLVGGADVVRSLFKRSDKARELTVLVATCALLTWLDDAPWTYGEAVLGATAIALCQTILPIERPASHPMLPDGQKPAAAPKLRTLLFSAISTLLIIALPYGLKARMSTYTPTSMPPSPSPPSPLLEILVLTYPRPNVTLGTTILSATVDSYLPHLSSDVVLSVFTHSTSHPALDNTRNAFAKSNITFYVDTDSHSDAMSGQYLHLAEAFRWSLERSAKAEWVMLVEDDFPVCGGEKGWDAIRRVMNILEKTRSPGSGALNRQGGFVGTGGSGLIIHRTTLPVLRLLMHTHAETASKLPPNAPRRPADLIIQDCLLGSDPLCPKKTGGGGLVITSRLVLDHIGGMATTNPNKALNDDKWRCGWRHPFHGRPQVEVVVV